MMNMILYYDHMIYVFIENSKPQNGRNVHPKPQTKKDVSCFSEACWPDLQREHPWTSLIQKAQICIYNSKHVVKEKMDDEPWYTNGIVIPYFWEELMTWCFKIPAASAAGLFLSSAGPRKESGVGRKKHHGNGWYHSIYPLVNVYISIWKTISMGKSLVNEQFSIAMFWCMYVKSNCTMGCKLIYNGCLMEDNIITSHGKTKTIGSRKWRLMPWCHEGIPGAWSFAS